MFKNPVQYVKENKEAILAQMTVIAILTATTLLVSKAFDAAVNATVDHFSSSEDEN